MGEGDLVAEFMQTAKMGTYLPVVAEPGLVVPGPRSL